jgi:hypothetical protein
MLKLGMNVENIRMKSGHGQKDIHDNEYMWSTCEKFPFPFPYLVEPITPLDNQNGISPYQYEHIPRWNGPGRPIP